MPETSSVSPPPYTHIAIDHARWSGARAPAREVEEVKLANCTAFLRRMGLTEEQVTRAAPEMAKCLPPYRSGRKYL